MRKNLLSGLILLLPIAVTVVVFVFLVDLLTTPFLGNMENLLRLFGRHFSINIEDHSTLLLIISRIVILITLFFGLIVLGFLGKRLFFNWIVKMTHELMIRIPFINTVYKVCRDIIEAVLSEDKKLISRVVIVPFPNTDSRTIGLVMGNAPDVIEQRNPSQDAAEKLSTVMVLTSPHPMSGFCLLVAEKHLKPLDISIEDVFKFLISCGAFIPKAKQPEKNETTDPQKSDSPTGELE